MVAVCVTRRKVKAEFLFIIHKIQRAGGSIWLSMGIEREKFPVLQDRQ